MLFWSSGSAVDDTHGRQARDVCPDFSLESGEAALPSWLPKLLSFLSPPLPVDQPEQTFSQNAWGGKAFGQFCLSLLVTNSHSRRE